MLLTPLLLVPLPLSTVAICEYDKTASLWPLRRFCNSPGADLEIQILKHFPKAALFIEKPISTAPVVNALNLAHYLEEKRVVASVGYMLRYLKVIQHMKNIIESTGKPVMMTVARYVCSYAKIKSEVWWNKSKSCGPIVEQGTHLVDLCRYFGGPVLLDTVQATSTEVRMLECIRKQVMLNSLAAL